MKIVQTFVFLAVGLPQIALASSSQETQGQLYALLAGPEHSEGSLGGGVAMRKTDVVQCAELQIAAPGGRPKISFVCLNSAGNRLTGDWAAKIYSLLKGPARMAGGGGLAWIKTQEISCLKLEIAAPGRGVQTKYSCE